MEIERGCHVPNRLREIGFRNPNKRQLRSNSESHWPLEYGGGGFPIQSIRVFGLFCSSDYLVYQWALVICWVFGGLDLRSRLVMALRNYDG
ncbi:hypothetical protein TorRG33x02_251360 [Trema orientale]|uniref:Uncharacterized protein n=1 Tax=Trema orientale TaxID=63057 RepID=A0A2P5DGY7_TREOI|nr:hypothetical protein TorRG33x02_251360 [Trema orientale]